MLHIKGSGPSYNQGLTWQSNTSNGDTLTSPTTTTEYSVTSNPYTFTDLANGPYTFTLQILSNDLEVAPNPDPPIYNSMNIIIAIPEVSITSPVNNTTIYNNTFELTYTTTNLGPNNKIVLYQGTDGIPTDVTSNPYPVKDLIDGSYTFTLKVVSKNINVTPDPNPVIQNQITNITIAIPEVSITNTETTIYNNTFELTYSDSNLGDNTIVLYQKNTNTSEIVKTVNNITGGYYTFTHLDNGIYTFTLQIVNDYLTPDPAIQNQITNITIAIPEVSITNTETTIYNNTFELTYNATNVGPNNKIVLYQNYVIWKMVTI